MKNLFRKRRQLIQASIALGLGKTILNPAIADSASACNHTWVTPEIGLYNHGKANQQKDSHYLQ